MCRNNLAVMFKNSRRAVDLPLMEGQAAMNVADPRARPLHRAALRGLEAFVRTLLVSGRDDANAVDTSGCAPMHWAAQGGSAGCIAQLAAAGADPNAPSTDGQSLTPLHVAAEHGQAASVCALVAAGAALEARCASGRTPLWAAAYFGQLAAVRALLDVGASLEARDVQGRCVLHAASSRGHADVVEALVAAGADAESQNNCACSAECCGPHAAGEGSSMAADAVAGSEDDCTTSVVEGVADSGADAQHGVAQPLSRKRSRPLAAEQLLPQLAAAVAAGEPQQKRLKEV